MLLVYQETQEQLDRLVSRDYLGEQEPLGTQGHLEQLVLQAAAAHQEHRGQEATQVHPELQVQVDFLDFKVLQVVLVSPALPGQQVQLVLLEEQDRMALPVPLVP